MEISIYEKIGDENIKKLIHDFYTEIKEDELLSPMYEGDFEGAENRLYMFMVQYLGGPTTYSEQRGHPALRRRHAPYPVEDDTIKHWLRNMQVALSKSVIDDEHKNFLWEYFQKTADFLRNRN
ncbi:MAG: globin [Bacteroidales bacterium]|nr:globin [Bacteroidales bacterium]